MKLSERAMLVDLDIRVCSISRDDPGRAAEIASRYGADRKMGRYSRYIVDPDSLKPILKLKGEMRNRHYELTLPWRDGARILANTGYLRYRDEMADYKNRLEPLFAQWCDQWPTLVAQARTLLNGLSNPADYNFDPRDKFGVSVRIFPVEESGDFRTQLDPDQVEYIRQSIEANVQTMTADAMKDAMDRVRQSLSHLSDRMKGYKQIEVKKTCAECGGTGLQDGTTCPKCVGDGYKWGKGTESPFRDSLTDNLRDLIDTLPGLNITGDPDVDIIISDMRQNLTRYSVSELREDETARERTARAADDILRRISDYGL